MTAYSTPLLPAQLLNNYYSLASSSQLIVKLYFFNFDGIKPPKYVQSNFFKHTVLRCSFVFDGVLKHLLSFKLKCFKHTYRILQFKFELLFLRWADPGGTAIPDQPATEVVQAPSTPSFYKNQFNICCPPMEDLSDVKLIRTDTTL